MEIVPNFQCDASRACYFNIAGTEGFIIKNGQSYKIDPFTDCTFIERSSPIRRLCFSLGVYFMDSRVCNMKHWYVLCCTLFFLLGDASRPAIKYCRHGGFYYKNGQSYKTDPCTDCKCIKGQPLCMARLCQDPLCGIFSSPIRKNPNDCCFTCS
ncbi:hypothetical protein Btru_051666 [Bulinus truncatus]|nr:hypothetical protein Btru_051666 [Bulinus truncatus]